MRILIVDDHSDSLETFTALLRLWGHEVQGFRQPVLALSEDLSFQPDVVFLGLRIPDMDGCEIAQGMRRHKWLKGAVLIAMACYGLDEDREKAKAAGFSAYILKAGDPGRIKRFLESLPDSKPWPSTAAIEDLERVELRGHIRELGRYALFTTCG